MCLQCKVEGGERVVVCCCERGQRFGNVECLQVQEGKVG